jgi:AcrR family transcriptional regulator
MGSRSPRAERRRAALLEAAKSVFVERGYAEATLDEVIARAGGSRATLYKQFGGKEGLFAAVIAEICAAMVAPLADGGPDRPPEDVLLAFGRSFMAALMAPDGLALYRVVIGNAQRFPELAAAVYRSGPATAAALLAAHLRRWKARGQIDLPDPDMAARHFLEMVKGDLHFRALVYIDPPSQAEIDQCVKGAVRLFMSSTHK